MESPSWAPFLVRRTFSGSCWCRTPVRNNDRHSSIMVNIIIVFLLHNVCVCTIVKGEGVSPNAWTHNDAWCPNIFPFSLSCMRAPSNIFLYIISFYHSFSCVYRDFALSQFLIYMSIYHIILSFMSNICHIINLSCLQTHQFISCTCHTVSYIMAVT